jgi:hypothetical protein
MHMTPALTSVRLCEAPYGLADADVTIHHPGCGWYPLGEAVVAVGLASEVEMKPALDAPAVAGVPFAD